MALINLAPHSAAHDDYALRLHLQVVNVIDAPSLYAISEMSLLLSVLATCADMTGRTLKHRADPSSKAIAATTNVMNKISGRKGHAPNVEEAKVLIACSGPLDRLFRRYPASRLEAVEAKIRLICADQLDERKAA